MKTETRVGLFILVGIGIFFYLSISIGSFRFDRDRFNFFKAYFDDTGGLEVKDPVKIAGVDVGWVNDIKLDKSGKAVVVFRIRKENKLAKNAYAMVRQEGLIGNKYLEVASGDSSTGILTPGSALGLPSLAPPTIGELLNKFGAIADSIKAVANSMKGAIGTRQGEDNMRRAIEGFAKASESIAKFSAVLDRSLSCNEENLNLTLSNFRDFTGSLKTGIPSITEDIHGIEKVTTKLASNTLPEFSEDFKYLSKKGGSAMESFEDASVQAREGFREAEQVMEKINSGKGLVGKLINEDETYGDFKKTVKNFKNQTNKLNLIDIALDMHGESMVRDWNNKGYFELRMRPTQDYFYNIQLVVDERGSVDRQTVFNKRFDNVGNHISNTNDFFPERIEQRVQKEYDTLFGLQFGKRFDRLALRVGLFESTFGMGIDYYVPLHTDKFHWITTFEAFDFQGVNRISDTRPHVKWLNKVFFMRNLYTSFGVDDMLSKCTASPFFGGGLRFGDRDLKFLLPSLPISSITKK